MLCAASRCNQLAIALAVDFISPRLVVLAPSPNLPISLPPDSGCCTAATAIEPPPLAPKPHRSPAIRPKAATANCHCRTAAREPKVCSASNPKRDRNVIQTHRSLPSPLPNQRPRILRFPPTPRFNPSPIDPVPARTSRTAAEDATDCAA
ncbi:uncharacterized protein TrAtP1_001406 [Trichoderma atroviride]|uniref:uncharacterized protein n=1 Tax=Hypocrea atroviridis TaxID=63577 RepID=UPI0033174AC6|nr:hypothetical protein TrAtP1_001406 [Trichoderma atroviride]